MKSIVSDKNVIAFCGLYCGACRQYLSEKCPGCRANTKATWCQVRACGLENQYASCADCRSYANVMDCKKFNNFMARLFGLIFRSNRAAGIAMIKQQGYAGYALYMAQNKLQTIKK